MLTVRRPRYSILGSLVNNIRLLGHFLRLTSHQRTDSRDLRPSLRHNLCVAFAAKDRDNPCCAGQPTARALDRWQGREHADQSYLEVFARASRQCDLAKASGLAKVTIPSAGLALSWVGPR